MGRTRLILIKKNNNNLTARPLRETFRLTETKSYQIKSTLFLQHQKYYIQKTEIKHLRPPYVLCFNFMFIGT